MNHDAHIHLYDLHIFMQYCITAKQRDDICMTIALKQAINVHFKSFRFIRIGLLRHYPDYLLAPRNKTSS